MTTPQEPVAWAAGLFEGEGCVTVSRNELTTRLPNTDESIVRRFWDVVQVGTVYGPSERRERDGFKRKPFWVWVATKESALDALELLGPWLSERRLARAFELTGLRFDALEWEADTAETDISQNT
jgi:hypothetical protein